VGDEGLTSLWTSTLSYIMVVAMSSRML